MDSLTGKVTGAVFTCQLGSECQSAFSTEFGKSEHVPDGFVGIVFGQPAWLRPEKEPTYYHVECALIAIRRYQEERAERESSPATHAVHDVVERVKFDRDDADDETRKVDLIDAEG